MKELEPYQKELIAEYKRVDTYLYKLIKAIRNAVGSEKQFRTGAEKSLIVSQIQSMDIYLGDLRDRLRDEGIENEAVERFDYPGDMSDGYHTFNELYRYRMLYNAAFLNTYAQPQTKVMSDGNISIIVPNVGKSWLHHDGTEPFGGGWFIVWFTTPDGHTITNHYETQYWDLFKIPEEKTGPEWNGSTPQQEADYLEQWLRS